MSPNWSNSPETPSQGQIRRFVELCDLEIWLVASKNSRAPLLCCFQLCAWFHCRMWIQTGVRVRKRLSWVLASVTLAFDLWPWPFAWTSLLSMVITPGNFMVIRWWEHAEKVWRTDGRTDRQTETRTDGLNQSYSCLVAAKKGLSCTWYQTTYVAHCRLECYTIYHFKHWHPFQNCYPVVAFQHYTNHDRWLFSVII